MAYAEPRAANSGALALTIGLNAAAVLAVAAWDPNIFHLPPKPWTSIHVGPPPLPPAVPPEDPKPKPRQQIDSPIPKVPSGERIDDPRPTFPDPGPIAGGLGGGSGTISEPPPPPPPPVRETVKREVTMATSPSEMQPPYPPALQRAEVEGSVTVRVLVGRDGRPRDIVLMRADDPGFFVAAKSWGMRHWRFKSASEDGTPVESWFNLTVRFTIE